MTGNEAWIFMSRDQRKSLMLVVHMENVLALKEIQNPANSWKATLKGSCLWIRNLRTGLLQKHQCVHTC